MIRKEPCAVIFIVLLLLIAASMRDAWAQSPPPPKLSGRVIHVKPHELTSYLGGERVIALMRDGSWLEGKVLGATGDTLHLVVNKEGSSRFKKGRHAVPAAEFLSFSLKKTKRLVGRTILTPTVGLLGAAAGSVIGYVSGNSFGDPHKGSVGLGMGLVLGCAGGYLIGREIDREKLIIMVEK